MKRGISIVNICVLLCSAHAGPTEDAIVAAVRLSEASNYSWIATVSDDARTYDIEGKTVRGGFTRVRMPVINTVRRQLGRSIGDTQIELIFRGNVDCVVETDHGWQRPSELPPAATERAEPAATPGPFGGSMRGGRMRGAGGRSALPPRDVPERSYSNLQLAVSHPHEELAVIVGSHSSFVVEGESVAGELTDLGAQLLLVRDGQDAITPLQASGSFRIWVRNGAVAHYQVKLQGTLRVSSRSGQRDVRVNQTTDTIIKDVGTTVVDIPGDARAKFDGAALVDTR